MTEKQYRRELEESFEDMKVKARNLYEWAKGEGCLDVYSTLMAQSAQLMIQGGIERNEAVATVIMIMPPESRHLFPGNFDAMSFIVN